MSKRAKKIIASILMVLWVGGLIIAPHIVGLISYGVLIVGLILFVGWLFYEIIDFFLD